MKNIFKWQSFLVIIFLSTSFIIYRFHYKTYNDLHSILFYGIMDIAFLFIQVLIASLILDNVLSYREKQILLNKMNMVIGAFYSELGTSLLKTFSSHDKNNSLIAAELTINSKWKNKDYSFAIKKTKTHSYLLSANSNDLKELKMFLVSKKGFMLRLLENPNLLEHNDFTDILWSVFHIIEELEYREEFDSISKDDLEHLNNDIRRAYILILAQWLTYMKHLQREYPFLFSLAVRKNPYKTT